MRSRRTDARQGAGEAARFDGVLIIDKPSGPTSHDVVTLARRALGVSRVGHTGTLDPMATGVLPLVVGRATRLAQYFTAGHKTYEATVGFGRTTDTYDATGTVLTQSAARPTREQVDAALARFRGRFEQVPPAFSAKNIDGTRAYTLARQGDATAVRPKAASVAVQALEVLAFDGDSATLGLRVTAGFYVRSLAHDLGAALGMGAVLDALRRTESGEFRLDQAMPLAELLQADRDAIASRVVPFDTLLPGLPAVVLSTPGIALVRNGVEVGPAVFEPPLPPSVPAAGLVRLMGTDGRLVGLARAGARPGYLHASAVFGLT